MQFHTKRMQLRVDWLMLLFPLISAALGQGEETVLLLISLFIHESAHLLAARLLNISIHSLRLTPFGGMSRIENPYSLSALRLMIVSAAGPAANLLMILVCASLAYWQVLQIPVTARLIEINAILMLFNLLPALPLDGGRILYSLLALFLPRRQAAGIGIQFGRLLAGTLILFALWGFFHLGSLNLSPVFAAVFLIVSAEDERRALTDSRIRTLMDSLRPLSKPTRAQIIAIDASASPQLALQSTVPHHLTLFAVFKDGHFIRFTDEQALLSAILDSTEKNT